MTPFSNLRAFLGIAAKWAVLAVCASGVIGVACLSRWVFAFVWPLICIASAVAAYFIVSIGVSLTPGVVELGVANGISMWSTLVSGQLIAVAAAAALLSVVIVLIRWRCVTASRRETIVIGLLSAAAAIIPVNISPSVHIAVTARLPFSLYYSFSRYYDSRTAISEVRTTYDNVNVAAAADAPDVYVVIGESLRYDHIPQNGYHRNTMPLMSLDTALISFPRIYSEAFYTHASVPVIMTDTDSLTRDEAYSRQSFISLFNKAGYSSAWFANQDFSDSYAPFAHEADTLVYCSKVMSVYSYEKYLDTDIIPHIDRWLDSETAKPRLAVIHTIGSHWWYRSHYPDSEDNFMPDIDSHDVGSLSHEQMVNSYDNTILETDRFISALCQRLRERDAVVIYISDHGENLGENGAYLHATPGDFTHRPACMIWYSEAYARLRPAKVDAIKRYRDRDGNTDAIFHTVVDLADLTTEAFTPQRSLIYGEESH